MNILKYISGLLALLMLGCQLGPTKLKQEVGGNLDLDRVLIDIRSSLDYETYHVSASVHLQTQDFLILKTTTPKTYQLDPDIAQIIERLARRGVFPDKKILLVSKDENSEEIKKWTWLLNQLNFKKIESISLKKYILNNKPLRPRPEPKRSEVWTVNTKENILKNSDNCFVNWVEETCN